jgi:hypothetical protein
LLPIKVKKNGADEAYGNKFKNKMNSPNVSVENPVNQKKPISIETALQYGASDQFYYVVDPEQTFDEKNNYQECEIISINMINIEYENEPCSMILFRNWTQNFKY